MSGAGFVTAPSGLAALGHLPRCAGEDVFCWRLPPLAGGVSRRGEGGLRPGRGVCRCAFLSYTEPKLYPMRDNQDRLLRFARDLRKNMPKGEARLWLELQGRRLGCKFRRQHIVGPFIVDFACLERRLIVEVDGSQHTSEADRPRQEYLEAAGFRVIRFWSRDVLDSTPQVVKEIRCAVEGREPAGTSVELGGELIARENEYPWPERLSPPALLRSLLRLPPS